LFHVDNKRYYYYSTINYFLSEFVAVEYIVKVDKHMKQYIEITQLLSK